MNKKLLSIMLLIILTGVSSQTSSNASISAPAIEWQQNYGHAGILEDTGIQSASNLIQTSDGGYIFMDRGWAYQFTFVPSTIYKVNSSGSIQWKKTIDFLTASTIIQTNDEGYEISGQWSTYGTTYELTPTLVKTDSQGNIQWVANYSSVPDLGVASTSIQTSDGGFAYWTDGTITKTDSENDTQWIKNLTYPTIDAYPTYTHPLALSSLIETSDGALAALGVGYNLLDNPRSGKIYLIKTEAFLPLPLQTPLPTPLPTPSATPTSTPYQIPIIGAAFVALAFAVGIGLLVYFKKRKR